MAWQITPAVVRIDDYTFLLDGAGLAAFAANPASLANLDTGGFTTAAAGANLINNNAVLADWGPGRGRWKTGDENRVRVEFRDKLDTNTDRRAKVAGGGLAPTVVGVDLNFAFHSVGAAAHTDLDIFVTYLDAVRKVGRGAIRA